MAVTIGNLVKIHHFFNVYSTICCITFEASIEIQVDKRKEMLNFKQWNKIIKY